MLKIDTSENSMNYIINILKYPSDCTNYPTLLKKEEFKSFLDILNRNRLTSFLQHYITCVRCIKKTTWSTKQEINERLLHLKTKRIVYSDIKIKLKSFLRRHNVPYLILKDHLENKIKGYPSFYIPLKFDLDIMGNKNDLFIFRTLICSLGYYNQKREFGSANWSISQYKFKPLKMKKYYPQIEFRFKAITTRLNLQTDIINQKNINDFSQELLNSVRKKPKDKFEPFLEQKLVHLCLIFFIEDMCKGLNNLFRIFLFLKTYQKYIDWEKIRAITQKYKVTKVVNFVIFLANSVFNGNRTGINTKISRDFLLLRKLITNKYIINSFYNAIIINREISSDFYAHFVLSAVLAEVSFWQKIIFFLNPRRFFILLKYTFLSNS
jgi:hypothetical protein